MRRYEIGLLHRVFFEVFFQFAGLERLARVLCGRDLPCAETDAERRSADNDRDSGDPQK